MTQDEASRRAQTPLLLDLNGDGVRSVGVDHGVLFDVNNQGQVALTGWASASDGMLVRDINRDGLINNGAELFGNGTLLANGSHAANGFDALAQFDANHDGKIDSQDVIFKELNVWRDANGDGVTQANELLSLQELGIASFNLSATSNSTGDNGNWHGLLSSYTTTNGAQHELVDVWFDSVSLASLVQQKGQLVDLAADAAANVQDVRLADVSALSQKVVVVKAGANDTVNLDAAGWSKSATTTTLENHTYNLWHNGVAHALIDQNAQVHQVL